MFRPSETLNDEGVEPGETVRGFSQVLLWSSAGRGLACTIPRPSWRCRSCAAYGLRELVAIPGRLGLPVERDCFWTTEKTLLVIRRRHLAPAVSPLDNER